MKDKKEFAIKYLQELEDEKKDKVSIGAGFP